jgi:hypothetical protein
MIIKQILFYLICIIVHSLFFSWQIQLYGLRFKTFFYLTNISFFNNYFYLISQFCKKTGIYHTSKEVRDNMFKLGMAFAVPVNILFWGIIAIDKNLIFNNNSDILPLPLNLFLHGGNMLVLLLDNYFITKHYITKSLGWRFLLSFASFYSVFLHFLYHFFSIELYGLVSKLNLAHYLIIVVFGFMFFLSGNALHSKMIINKERMKKTA